MGQQIAHDHEESPAPAWGLVLAGGASRRMGEDKGSLDFHGVPQAVWTRQQLDEFCERTFVSVNAGQETREPYADLPTIAVETSPIGPASGLISAWTTFPQAAWLVVAVDMPFLNRGTLTALIEGRDRAAMATVFEHPDGTLEPLCAIWEAAARPVLLERVQAGHTSLRRCLEAGQTQILVPPMSQALISVNSPAEYQDARRRLFSGYRQAAAPTTTAEN